MNNETYLNPVYSGSFPDPFVLKYCGEYWAYCTGIQPDGRCFGILHSADLVNWEQLAGAMEPLPGGHTMYWAPEVFYYNGIFYLYYSVGNETLMQVRVAVASDPAGPFTDSGHTLTTETFAIDAHVFQDDDGATYLFYATDFLEHTHIGTGTVMDRLLDPFTLEGRPRPVTRARYDWQVYDPARKEKGGVRWHTIEGPFVLKHKNRYYQMFSGGNWQNLSYGTSYAVSETIEREDEWVQVADGQKVFPVLRTIPGKVIGPGHNSAVSGPDNRQMYCVYHRWAEDGSARLMAIDPLDWAGERLIVLGPSYTPQFTPTLPSVTGFNRLEETVRKPGQGWTPLKGDWLFASQTAARQGLTGPAEAAFHLVTGYFLVEISLTCQDFQPDGAFGLGLNRAESSLLSFMIEPEAGRVRLAWTNETGSQEQILPLPAGFNPAAYHLLRLEVQGQQAVLWLDHIPVPGRVHLAAAPDNLRLLCHSAAATFAGFGLTPGWEDLFTGDTAALQGWQLEAGQVENLRAGQGHLENTAGSEPVIITKGAPLENYELTVNALLKGPGQGESYGFYPAWGEKERGPGLVLRQHAAGWALQPDQDPPLVIPAGFDPQIFQQFRFRKQGNRLTIAWEDHFLGEIKAPAGQTRIGVFLGPGGAAFDRVRVTAV